MRRVRQVIHGVHIVLGLTWVPINAAWVLSWGPLSHCSGARYSLSLLSPQSLPPYISSSTFQSICSPHFKSLSPYLLLQWLPLSWTYLSQELLQLAAVLTQDGLLTSISAHGVLPHPHYPCDHLTQTPHALTQICNVIACLLWPHIWMATLKHQFLFKQGSDSSIVRSTTSMENRPQALLIFSANPWFPEFSSHFAYSDPIFIFCTRRHLTIYKQQVGI